MITRLTYHLRVPISLTVGLIMIVAVGSFPPAIAATGDTARHAAPGEALNSLASEGDTAGGAIPGKGANLPAAEDDTATGAILGKASKLLDPDSDTTGGSTSSEAPKQLAAAGDTAHWQPTSISNSPAAEDLTVPAGMSQTSPHRMFSLYASFEKADKDNKEVHVASSTLPIAQAAIVIAKAIPNPTYSMVYGFGNSFKYIIAGNQQSAGFSEEILVAGKRSKRMDVAKANYVQTAFQLEAVRFDVHNRVRRAYAELAAAHAYADLIESQRDVAKKLLDISQKRFNAGKAPGSEVLQAKLGVMQFDTQRNQAWGRIMQDSVKLSFLLGDCHGTPEIIDVEENGLFQLSTKKNALVPDPTRGLPPLPQLLPVAWRERNDLKAAIQTAYAQKKQLALTKTQRIPDPVVGFQYGFSFFKPYQFGFFDPAGVLSFLQGIYPGVPQLVPSFNNPNPSAPFVEALYFGAIANGNAFPINTPPQATDLNGNPATDVNGNPIDVNGNPFPTPSQPTQAPEIKRDRVSYQNGLQLLVNQETPLYYQYQGEINQAKATWIQELKQNDQMRAQIATDIVTAYESVLVSRANIKKFQEQTLPAALRVAQMTRRGYELGKMDLATAILAQQQYQQLLSSYFDAVVAYQNAWADLEKTVGVPLNL